MRPMCRASLMRRSTTQTRKLRNLNQTIHGTPGAHRADLGAADISDRHPPPLFRRGSPTSRLTPGTAECFGPGSLRSKVLALVALAGGLHTAGGIDVDRVAVRDVRRRDDRVPL